LHLFSAIIGDTTLSESWYLDSDTSQHMSPLQHLFHEYTPLATPKTILLGDNSSHQAQGYGSVVLQLIAGQLLSICDVLYIPKLAKKLLSIAQITNIGNTIVIFTKDGIIKSSSSTSHYNLVLKINKDGNFFSLGTGIIPSIQSYTATILSKSELATMTWHH
jgi:hypothetical protein